MQYSSLRNEADFLQSILYVITWFGPGQNSAAFLGVVTSSYFYFKFSYFTRDSGVFQGCALFFLFH